MNPLPPKPQRRVSEVSSLIAGNRLECRPRSVEFNRSLRAEVRDATWMLSRQWQLKEFRAEDRGAPVLAEVELEHSRLNQLRLGGQTVVNFNELLLPLPLDALVQAQPPVVDVGLRLQMGHHWERLVRSANLSGTLAAFRTGPYRLNVPAASATYSLAYGLALTTPEATEILSSVAGKAIDGYALYEQISLDRGKAADAAGESRTSATGLELIRLGGLFLDWFTRVYALPSTAGPAAWSVPNLEYQFEAAAPVYEAAAAAVAVRAQEHTGGSLDWYSMDENKAACGFTNTKNVATRKVLQFVPTEIQFAGAPNARWWEFEDRKVDFGKLSADSSDFARMLLQEFMFLYQNDWFSLPYQVPAGSLCTVLGVYVTDVFGQRYRIQPAGQSQLTETDGTPIEEDWGGWSMYALSKKGERRDSVPRLLLPATAVAPQVGKVVEQVVLLREESTNLVWGVEQTISDGLGRGMDGTGAAARLTEYLRSRADATPRPPKLAKYEYQLATPVAENWIPFVPSPGATVGEFELVQGEMVRQVEGLALTNNNDDGLVKARTSLLRLNPNSQYVLHEQAVPPTGVRVDSAYRRARWYNGETVLWYSRSLGPGRTASSSGLAYDQLIPRTVSTETASYGVYAAVLDPATATKPALIDRVRMHPLNVVQGPQGAVTVIADVNIEKNRSQLKAMLQ